MTEALNKVGRELYKKYCEHKDIANKDWDRGHKNDYEDFVAEGIEEAMDILQKVYEEYHKLEEQGLLLHLPCKVGDTVYIPEDSEVEEAEVERIVIDEEGRLQFVLLYLPPFFSYDFGKTVFLTKPEAEEALKKMREGE